MKRSSLISACAACLITSGLMVIVGLGIDKMFLFWSVPILGVGIVLLLFILIQRVRKPEKISTPYKAITASRDWQKVVAEQNDTSNKSSDSGH